MDQGNYAALKTELDTDPKTLGYSGKTSQEIADLLNTVGLSSETVNIGVIDSYEIINVLDASEVAALSTTKLQTLMLITSTGKTDASNANVKLIFQSLFGAGTNSRTALLALANKSASRAEALGFGTVEKWDIERAQTL